MEANKSVFGLYFSLLDARQIVEKVLEDKCLENDPLRSVITTNVDHLVNMSKNPEFKTVCQDAWLLTADGFPVYKFLSFIGIDVPARITGADLFPPIIKGLNRQFHTPFLLCSTKETAQFYIHWLKEFGYANAEDLVVIPPFGFEFDDEYSRALVAKIKEKNCTHLFMGVGAPKSELWMAKYRNELKGMYGFGFGAGLDFFANTMKRAPVWMQSTGLEWSWRLLNEPKRLFKRYLVNSWAFLAIASRELKQQRSLEG